ncbi:MAG: 3-hydroxyacyl-CoA dehydrogenase NAD-binding domain-containing protein, partial [Deltaproteobacteria bacterium]|nr:3-hydroxyacyl-CoA dehydrogenase NAD-binding domain-containing protein [Deltaproteobacteria bacterium]
MNISKVFIVGAGLMGSGIAQVCAQVGINVLITDVNQEILNRALKNIAWSVSKLIEKGKVKESLESIMGRIRVGTDWENISPVDLAIEA